MDKYSGSILRKRSSSPKFQVFNNALITSQLNDTFKTAKETPKKWRRLMESLVGTHLINFAVSEKYNLYYWREGNYEIDFILERGNKVIGLEVKSGVKAYESGITLFREWYQPEKILMVVTGGIPFEEFLKINPGELF